MLPVPKEFYPQDEINGQVKLVSGDPSIPSGVYSGVDIRLIVHLPYSQEEQDRLSAIIATVDQQLSQDADELKTIIMGPTYGSTLYSTERVNRLRESINISAEELNQLKNQQTSSQAVTKELAEIQTLSISIHREKFPVRPLGSVYPKSFTRGPRSLSGSMVWTVFHEHIFTELLESTRFRSTGVGDFDNFVWTTAITDQIPPMDITITFSNEYGNNSMMTLMGVEFVNEGMVLSIEDLFVEGTAQWIARDIDLLRNITPRPMIQNMAVGSSPTGSRLLMDSLRSRVLSRRNPFL